MSRACGLGGLLVVATASATLASACSRTSAADPARDEIAEHDREDSERNLEIIRKRTWLDVKLPPPPRAGVPRGQARISLDDKFHASALEHAGVRLWVGNAEPRLLPVGQRATLAVAASRTEPLRMEVAGIAMLAFVRPGEAVSIIKGHDERWWALLDQRMTENAPRTLTICSDRGTAIDCPAGYLWTYAYRGDEVCRVPIGESYAAKCVKAPLVRVRGPFAGKAETAAGGELLPLTAGDVDANAAGPWHPLDIGRERMAWVRLGDAEAILVLGPGDACEVWLDDQKRVAARLVKAPEEPKPPALGGRGRGPR